MKLGIEDISLATTSLVLDLDEVAAAQGADPDKFRIGIGQDSMSIPAPDEDVVTLGAQAAQRVLHGQDLSAIRTVLFATESGVDQSKSAGVYMHRLLGLNPNARVIEFKQACYSGTGALQLALALVARNPEQKVLVVAADIARYDAGSSGEPTQGAAAVAMLISATPDVLAIEPVSGLYTQDIMDFWRPNYRSTAIVDGRYSIKAYLDSVKQSWRDYRAQGGHELSEFDHFCYHQPFTRQAVKGHATLAREGGVDAETRDAQLEHTLDYNRVLGNSYTASLYVGLLSLLDSSPDDLTGHRIGFFSYGSGAVGELFAGVVQPGYRTRSHRTEHRAAIDGRTPIDYARYFELHERPDDVDGGDHPRERGTTGPFRFAGVRDHGRVYEPTSAGA
ncbi:hydroxymethylglutaryl-CoA synthase [Mycetocola reblochoni]|uniref:Hydroxymethylglutaryl-CoA synthase n=2 Tax=Mycetocola reblochoni TaxID=331618 RepID=A0A1R4II31_9MICO|nr:hydroxymethylglutaryl-CoA synthase [Mycetocola reblochoni]RLP69650.1 hydroxymethylglutaryl-CoA synthase [Mycetocola reblochoni]SJN19441.1 Hydroxymethylglutaryl-CoA synthase [Mycetocola reblochoni REB411]